MKGFMTSVTSPKEGEESNPSALVARLRQFVENSDLSFYKIASRIGTSGGILSMWFAGTTRPRAEELAAIEKFLER
jgi:DNA transposition AAA+ family ATPase